MSTKNDGTHDLLLNFVCGVMYMYCFLCRLFEEGNISWTLRNETWVKFLTLYFGMTASQAPSNPEFRANLGLRARCARVPCNYWFCANPNTNPFSIGPCRHQISVGLGLVYPLETVINIANPEKVLDMPHITAQLEFGGFGLSTVPILSFLS